MNAGYLPKRMSHTSLEGFERRVREGKVSGKVDADVHVIVALIEVARGARALVDQVDAGMAGYMPPAFHELHKSLVSVPPERA